MTDLRIVLDTNIISLSLRGDLGVRRHLTATRRGSLAITSITWAELEFGSRRCVDAQRHRRAWQRAIRDLPVLSFTREDAVEHARVRDLLRERPIGERDLFIAAIAVANRCAVATRNVDEFRRVRGLKVLEWT